MDRAEYLRRWRKRKADMAALVESDTEDNDAELENEENTTHIDLDGHVTDPSTEGDETGLNEESRGTEEFTDHSSPESNFSSSGEHDEDEDMPTLSEELRELATEDGIKRETLSKMLKILRRHGHEELPQTARTLLQTPRNITAAEKCGGKYIYFGLREGILRKISTRDPIENTIYLDINIDGLPIFKSSSKQFWPILGRINGFNASTNPFLVALFFGTAKPLPLDSFLEDFIAEMTTVCGEHGEGVLIDGTHCTVAIRTFICDAPARCYLKCIKGHTGYFACERCQMKGTHQQGRVLYNDQDVYEARTDRDFSRLTYAPTHQVGESPLIRAGVNCVSAVVLDYMHLACLGVMRRMLGFWKDGPPICRLSARQRGQISEGLVRFNGLMPSEFARQPRSLNEMDRWKATELRQFMLYTGCVVLRDVLSEEAYSHYLEFSVGLSLLLESNDRRRKHYLNYARELLHHFVATSEEYFGATFTVYNVHSLLHIADDAEKFDCSLNDLSAFPFENVLQSVKKMVRNSKNPAVQVAKRLAECEMAKRVAAAKYKSRQIVRCTPKDCCFLMKDEHFAFVRRKLQDEQIVVDVVKAHHVEDFFTRPCHSKMLNIGFITTRDLQRRARRRTLLINQLRRKVVCLPYAEGYVLLPLLHGNEH